MRIIILSLTLLLCSVYITHAYEDQTLEDDDFAEFEQFEVDDEEAQDDGDFSNEDVPVLKPKLTPSKDQFEANIDTDDDIIVEDEDSEFEHFQDPEEFEGFQDNTPKSSEQPKITISKVPIMVRPRWDAYWLEGILCCLLAAYALAYAVGRAKNSSIATNFLKLHKPLLEDNFTLVGETGLDVVAAGDERGWRREAEHCFTMWCSGRQCCEGMLLTLKLIKRQDLVHVLLGVVRPTPDTLLIRVELGKDDSDPYVLCVAQKKIATRLAKEMQDLSMFCPEKRPGDKHGLPAALSVLSECAEATAGLMDARVTAALEQYHKNVQYIHVSDRYCGPKQMEETVATKPPDTERVMLVSLALGPDGGGEEVRPLLLLVFYLLDKIKRLRLSKEALSKCEKRRQKAAEAWVRGAHAARQEQAALRREEKRKQEKEKILAEDDPEKQRRWEIKEQKRQQKRKAPKMKQLKVKAL
nr:coiled-coil domain-containing protein 47 isoform X1 [Maniola hyperantus]